jgi:hypothetical protein
VATFEREGEVAQEAMDRVMEEAAVVAADVAVGKMHAAAARNAVEAVVMEAAMAALCTMRNDAAMVLLEAVAKEPPRLPCASCATASSCARQRPRRRCTSTMPRPRSRTSRLPPWWRPTSAWLLVAGNETEVEDDDEDEEAEAAEEAER